MRKPIQRLNALSTQPVVQTPINDANHSRLSCDMKARISQFEELDKHAAPLTWKEVKLRAQQQEEKRRKVVVTARRSLHLDVHVGGGKFLGDNLNAFTFIFITNWYFYFGGNLVHI